MPDIFSTSATASGTATKLHGCLVGLGDPWLVDNLGRVFSEEEGRGFKMMGVGGKLQVIHGNGVKSGVHIHVCVHGNVASYIYT